MVKKPRNNSDFGHSCVAQSVAHSESKMPDYLERRGNVYWFRRRAPSPLKPKAPLQLADRSAAVDAKGFIRFSLKTTELKEARRLARKYAHLVDEAAKDTTAGIDRPKQRGWAPLKPLENGEPTLEEIRFAADAMYAGLLGTDEHLFNKSVADAFSAEFGDGPVENDTEDERRPDRYHWSPEDLPTQDPRGQAQLIKQWIGPISFALYQHTGKTITEPTPALLPFADAIRRFAAAMEQRRQSSDVPTPTLPHRGDIWTWQEAFDYYFKQRPHLGQATRDNYRISWTSLAHSAKGTPASLTRDAVVTWRDDLLTKVEHRTAKNRLMNVAAIWRESYVNGKIPPATRDPFERLRVTIDSKSKTARTEFSVDELKKLFSAPPVTTAKAVSTHAGYWLPLLALFHGARLEELTGLEAQDLEDWNDSLILHIRENTVRPHLKHGKLSERSIPVHPQLITLGFRKYVSAARQAGVLALFPSFSRGATFGEAYVSHVKEVLKPAEGRIVGMHCFRHSWETARRNARLDPSAAQYMTGRRIDAGSAADYGGPAARQTLLEELSKIQYPIEFLAAPDVTPDELKQQDAIRLRSVRAKKGLLATKAS